MQHQRTYLLAYERRRLVEAAILALVLAEDWPWRAGELAQRLRLPAAVIGLSTATLSADGLIVSAGADRLGSGDRLRASWAAVRCDELLRQGPAISPPTRTNVESGCTPERPRYHFISKANDPHKSPEARQRGPVGVGSPVRCAVSETAHA